MREFESVFAEGLKRGLRRGTDNPLNSQYLTSAMNVKCYESGIRPFIPLQTVPGSVVTWPFGQAFFGSNVKVYATETDIYELDDNWTMTHKATATAGERWDFLDFGLYVLLLNRTSIVTRDPSSGSYTVSSSMSGFPRFSTGCNFKGQIVGGNIRTNWYDCGSGSLIWSDIGSAMFTPGVKNVAGYRHTPWKGKVLRVKRLGDVVVAYCENGIGILAPHEQTFGFKELLDIGIKGRAAVEGTVNKHLFIDADNWLWSIGSDLRPKKLGYQEYIKTLTNAVISYNPGEDEFFISDNVRCFLLTMYGMSECHQLISSVAKLGSTVYGCIRDTNDRDVLIITDALDFGLRGMKTVGTLELGLSCTAPVYVAVDYKYNKTTEFARTSWILCNPNGVVYVPTTAVEFRLCVKTAGQQGRIEEEEDGFVITLEDGSDLLLEGANYASFELDYITIRIKVSDKRYIRGTYATTASSRASVRALG
uniref:Uncharacterized protein n=1 Tax=viral metagenome TaxID=1070528 RepID=A0A6M3JA26_9ZZZZ